jgi:hypothetical protein
MGLSTNLNRSFLNRGTRMIKTGDTLEEDQKELLVGMLSGMICR